MTGTAQSSYQFTLVNGAEYRAELEEPARNATPGQLAYHIYNDMGLRLSRPVLPVDVFDVELFLLGWIVNWDAKLYRPTAQPVD